MSRPDTKLPAMIGRPLAAAALAALAAAAPAAAETFPFDGVARDYELFVPASARLPAPAMVILHGGGGNPGQIRDHVDFDDLAAELGIVAVYPGAVDKLWNDGRVSPSLADQQAQAGDDAGYIEALLDSLIAKGIVDPARVGVGGISNGGFMTLRLACAAPHRFAAFAVVAANNAVGIECPGGAPVPMLFIHGTEDEWVPYRGGTIAPQVGESRGTAYSAADTTAAWAMRNGCGAPALVASWNERPLDGTSVAIYDYAGCRAALRHIIVEGGGHTWPGARAGLLGLVVGRSSREIDANQAIWAFVSAQFRR